MATVIEAFGALYGYLFGKDGDQTDSQDPAGTPDKQSFPDDSRAHLLMSEMASKAEKAYNPGGYEAESRLLEAGKGESTNYDETPFHTARDVQIPLQRVPPGTLEYVAHKALEHRRSHSGVPIDFSDKLFSDLLDDVDAITENQASIRRRRRARTLFSEWLFNPEHSSPMEKKEKRKSKQSFEEFTSAFQDEQAAEQKDVTTNKYDRIHPGQFFQWRPDMSSSRLSTEDDADSGYNSGRLSSTQPPPGERTLTRDDLRKQIDAFNTNQHGLLMTLHENDVTFQGFIRVHMNLIRPISMSISTRPPSIYEVLTHEDQGTLNDDTGTQTTSFYLPKDTTKVIHIRSETTTQELIRALLQKFKITDNPRKFALYEKAVKDGKMRKLGDAERPLPLCLSWTAEGLNQHRFILQENDTMEIQWEAFSLPELENFLRILDREEAEYVDQVKAKYGLMKIHVQQRLKDMGLVHSDQRQPVFV